MTPARTATPDPEAGFVVAIHLEARPGDEALLADSLHALIAPTMAEPGVRVFLPCRSPSDPKAFFVFELYADEAGWQAHQQTPHFQRFAQTVVPRLARRERLPFHPLGTDAAARD
jgi:quinol monooxygenase YgiN